MRIHVVGKACCSCGSLDFPFYARKRKDRVNKISVSGKCILCHREDISERDRAWVKANWAKKYAHIKRYKEANREQLRAKARIAYQKKRRVYAL